MACAVNSAESKTVVDLPAASGARPSRSSAGHFRRYQQIAAGPEVRRVGVGEQVQTWRQRRPCCSCISQSPLSNSSQSDAAKKRVCSAAAVDHFGTAPLWLRTRRRSRAAEHAWSVLSDGAWKSLEPALPREKIKVPKSGAAAVNGDSPAFDMHGRVACGLVHGQRPFSRRRFTLQHGVPQQPPLVHDIDLRQRGVGKFLVIHPQSGRRFQKRHIQLIVAPFVVEQGDEIG